MGLIAKPNKTYPSTKEDGINKVDKQIENQSMLLLFHRSVECVKVMIYN